jgi:frataxin
MEANAGRRSLILEKSYAYYKFKGVPVEPEARRGGGARGAARGRELSSIYRMMRSSSIIAAACHYARSHGSFGVRYALQVARPFGGVVRLLSLSPDTSSEASFHASADSLLSRLETGLCAVEEQLDAGADISSSMGVLTIRLGPRGTIVLNKQTPTRQVWWSSPLSGPRRFEWSEKRGAWVDARSGAELVCDLTREIEELAGVKVSF